MPKAAKVGRFRAAAKATSRDVKDAPLTSQHLADRKKRDATTNDAPPSSKSETGPPAEKEQVALSRGQRKRLAKREQYLKRERMVMSSLRLQRLDEQRGKLDGLDALREALGEAAASKSESSASKGKGGTIKSGPTKCNTNRSKKNLANAEINHMNLVLDHPSFKSNPFAAIQTHLRNSLAPQAEQLKEESAKRDEETGKVQARKKEERKERIRDAKFDRRQRKGRGGYKSNRAGRVR